MAFQLLSGTTAIVDINIAIGSGSGTPVSSKCLFRRWMARITQEMFEQTVFCGGGWRSRIPGLKQLIGRLDGYMSVGNAASDPLAFFQNTLAAPFVLTATTSATISGNGWVTSDEQAIEAAANTSRGVDFESFGAVLTAWPIT